jgi:hypothetical protein
LQLLRAVGVVAIGAMGTNFWKLMLELGVKNFKPFFFPNPTIRTNCRTVIDSVPRKNPPETPFFEDLKRALFHLNTGRVEDINRYRYKNRDEAQQLG